MTLTADDRALLIRRSRTPDEVDYSLVRDIMRRITREDLLPFVPDLNRFTAIPYHPETHRHNATWSNVANDLLRENAPIFQYDVGLPNFFRWLEDQTAAVPSGDTTPEPAMTDAPTITDPTVAAFVDAYMHLPDVDPTLSVLHGHTNSRFDAPTQYDAQSTFLAMPVGLRAMWQSLYEQATDVPREVSLAGVAWEQARQIAYGYSTENFFRWCRRRGITTTIGVPIVPGTTTDAVPSGDTDQTRTIEYWNGLTRTNHWEPYLADLVRFIPEPASEHTGWDEDTVRCILGLPFGVRDLEQSQNGGWLRYDLDAHPGSARIHPFLGNFARAVVDGTFTLSTTTPTTPEVTITTEPVLTIELLNQPIHTWPRPVREAASDEIARFFLEQRINDDIERAHANSDHALLFEESGPEGYWRDREFGPHARFRAAVLDGSFVTTLTATTTTTPEVTTSDTPAAVIPIGPDHPGWHAFAERLAREATRAGMCPEYDRIARAVGLPTRKERVTYRITLDVAIDVERGENADIRALREAARTVLDTTTSSGARRFEQSRTQTVA